MLNREFTAWIATVNLRKRIQQIQVHRATKKKARASFRYEEVDNLKNKLWANSLNKIMFNFSVIKR